MDNYGLTVYGYRSRKDTDPRVAELEHKINMRAYDIEEQFAGQEQVHALHPPRFGQLQKQERLFFRELPVQLQLLTARTVIHGEKHIGFLLQDSDLHTSYEFLCAIVPVEIGQKKTVVIHKWAFDPKPKEGQRAATRFNTLEELLAYVKAPGNEQLLQGDIITFIIDRRTTAKVDLEADPMSQFDVLDAPEEMDKPLHVLCREFLDRLERIKHNNVGKTDVRHA